MLAAVESFDAVNTHTANIRRRFQFSREAIAPAVIGAANYHACRALLGDQCHTAVAADIVEYARNTLGVTNHQEWQTHEVHGINTSRFLNISTETESGPGLGNDTIALFLPRYFVGVVCVGQTGLWVCR